MKIISNSGNDTGLIMDLSCFFVVLNQPRLHGQDT